MAPQRAVKLWTGARHPLARRALRLGVAPATEHLSMLRRLHLNTVIDVGANTGQFALAARVAGFTGEIHSFEPLPEPSAVFRKVFLGDERVHLTERALSDVTGEAVIHESNHSDSSSLLAIGDRQESVFPGTAERRVRQVVLSRLDDELSGCGSLPAPVLLKIDVQGHELAVLRGAAAALEHIEYVYLEVSFETLYEHQPLADEILRHLTDSGYQLVEIGHVTFVSGKSIQADLLLRRPAPLGRLDDADLDGALIGQR